MSKKFYTKLDKTLRKYNILVLRCKRNRIYQGDVDGKKFLLVSGRIIPKPIEKKVLRTFKKQLVKVGFTNTELFKELGV
jgi:hypothetical protein|tara:strand:- start:271 stop:507 length:237 start_codon:yes stop_codon:yes gene_type:complete